VQELPCHGSYCELILSLARTSCRLSFPPALLPLRRAGRPPAGCKTCSLRNPSKSTLAHDAVAAAVLHKHHLIIRVGAGLIQFVYGSHSRMAADLPSTKIYFCSHFRGFFHMLPSFVCCDTAVTHESRTVTYESRTVLYESPTVTYEHTQHHSCACVCRLNYFKTPNPPIHTQFPVRLATFLSVLTREEYLVHTRKNMFQILRATVLKFKSQFSLLVASCAGPPRP